MRALESPCLGASRVCQDTGSLPRAGFRGAVARPVPRRRDDRLNVEERKDSSLPLFAAPLLSLPRSYSSLSLPLRVPAIARLFPRKRNPRSISARCSLAPSARRLITEACRLPSLLSSLASPVRSPISLDTEPLARRRCCLLATPSPFPRSSRRVFLPPPPPLSLLLADCVPCRRPLTFLPPSRSPSCSTQRRRLFCLIVDSFSQGIISAVQPRL